MNKLQGRAATTLLAGLPAALALLTALPASAQPAPARATTIDLAANGSNLTDGLPDGRAANLRLTHEYAGGHVAAAELLSERKFGSNGGIAAASYTRVLDPDWILAGTLAAGHGGPNWANRRIDVDLATKWLADKSLMTHVAAYHATFDNDRSDRGLRVSLVAYLPGTLVLEGGVIANISEPGRVHSRMPFVSATVGTAGVQYLSLRLSNGTEAYQALGSGQQLVNFRSRSAGLQWRRWLSDGWGVTMQAESYHNPSYERVTLGAGLFTQF